MRLLFPNFFNFTLLFISNSSFCFKFSISDERSPVEVAQMLRLTGYEPVWKDWDSSYQCQGEVHSAKKLSVEQSTENAMLVS